jgi:FMN reductase
MRKKVKIIGLGGSLENVSSTYFALKFVMDELKRRGAETIIYDIRSMKFPIFELDKVKHGIDKEINKFLDDVYKADGYILASPEYHGTVSGAFKNVVDYIYLLKDRTPPFITGKPAGCIATGGGEISGVTTLQSLINIVHNLRGIAVSGNTAIGNADECFNSKGNITRIKVKQRLERLASEVYELARKL